MYRLIKKNKIMVISVSILLGLVALVWLLWSRYSTLVEPRYYQEMETGSQLEDVYTGIGPYSTETEPLECESDSSMKCRVWYPSNMNIEDESFPAVIMTNGSNMTYSRYEPIYRHLASWGFIVVGNDERSTWQGTSSIQSLKALLSVNDDTSSIFHEKIDEEKIGISGGSQGGVGAINAVTNFKYGSYFKSIYTASTPSLAMTDLLQWSYSLSEIDIPYFMVAGTGIFDSTAMIPLDDLKNNFRRVSQDNRSVMARRVGSDHHDMTVAGDGYRTAWFLWTLGDDRTAGKVFKGRNAEIKHNENWVDVEIEQPYS